MIEGDIRYQEAKAHEGQMQVEVVTQPPEALVDRIQGQEVLEDRIQGQDLSVLMIAIQYLEALQEVLKDRI
jgi:hypothetical protein